MIAVKVSEQLDLVLPPEMGASLGLRPGERFAVIPKGRTITLVPIPELDELLGIAEGADTSGVRDRSDRT